MSMFYSYKRLLSLLVFFSFALPAFAQTKFIDAYILALNGDTLKGKIARTWIDNPKTITFKNASGANQAYAPKDILGFGFNDDYDFFLSLDCVVEEETPEKIQTAVEGQIKKQQQKVFAKRIGKGNLSLYQYIDAVRSYYFVQEGTKAPEYLVQETYYLTNTNGAKFLFQNTEYKKQLSKIFANAPKSLAKVEMTTYKATPLISLFEQYAKETQQNYNTNKPSNKLRVGVMAMLTTNKIKFPGPSSNEIYLHNFAPKTTGTIGLSFEKYFNRTRKTSSLAGNIFFTRFSEKVNFVSPSITTGILRQIWDIEIDVRHINLSVLYRYNFNTPYFRPFINAGVIFGASTKKYQKTQYTYGSVVSNIPFSIQEKTGFVIGAGGRYKKIEIKLDYTILSYRLAGDEVAPSASGNTILLGLGYWFN